MNTKEWFSLAVRILGLVFLYHGLITLPVSIGMAFGGGMSGAVTAVQILWQLGLALWLIGGAPLLMNIAFRE